MRKFCLLIATAVAVPVAAAGSAGAQTQAPASGQVQMTVHSHSGPGLQFPTDRLSFNFTQGETFAYSSRTCGGNAPFNDIGLNFTPNYPGVDDDSDSAARVRYGVTGTVIATAGNRGVIQGTIRAVLCVRDASGAWVASSNVLVMHFTAGYTLVSPNDLHLYGGFQFSPTESTGTFRDIQGGGRLEARFTCLGQSSCATGGEFNDFVVSTGNPSLPAGQLQPGMTGVYFDPTVGPIAA
jgi:hypothetical protein